jgi:hypothetical protein
MRAFRHLRDCDAALHLIGASPQSPLSLDFTRYPFPSGMAENRIKRAIIITIMCAAACH